jgi:hypothetical protein
MSRGTGRHKESGMPRAKQSLPKNASADGRSVNYPFITLEAAIGQAKRLWDSVGRNAVPIPTAAAAWGYGEKSSAVRSTVSALKQYGLLQDSGDGARRQIRLTDRAFDIVLEAAGSARRTDALRAAVLAPKIYGEIFERFAAGLPAQDHAINSFLLRDKQFNRKALAAFIASLRANIQFAGLHAGGATSRSENFEAESPAAANALLPGQTDSSEEHRPPGPSNQDVYTLGAEGRVVLQWPAKLSQQSYDELLEWIELELKKIARLNGLRPRRARVGR